MKEPSADESGHSPPRPERVGTFGVEEILRARAGCFDEVERQFQGDILPPTNPTLRKGQGVQGEGA